MSDDRDSDKPDDQPRPKRRNKRTPAEPAPLVPNWGAEVATGRGRRTGRKPEFRTPADRNPQLRAPYLEPTYGAANLTLNRDSIGQLARIGCTRKEIQAVLGVSRDTLQRAETADPELTRLINNGQFAACAELRRLQWKSATSGNVAMQIWLGKQYLGQSDRAQSLVTVRNEDSIAALDFKALSDSELAQLHALIGKAAAAEGIVSEEQLLERKLRQIEAKLEPVDVRDDKLEAAKRGDE